MSLHHRLKLALLASIASSAVLATTAVAQQFPPGMITGFEPPGPAEPLGYFTGPVLGQDLWQGGTRGPRVQTAEEIAAELTAAGLNPANPVRSGSQALLAAKVDTITETSPPAAIWFATSSPVWKRRPTSSSTFGLGR